MRPEQKPAAGACLLERPRDLRLEISLIEISSVFAASSFLCLLFMLNRSTEPSQGNGQELDIFKQKPEHHKSRPGVKCFSIRYKSSGFQYFYKRKALSLIEFSQ